MTAFPVIIPTFLHDFEPLFQANWVGPFVNGSDTYLFGRGFGSGDNQNIRVLKATDFSDPDSWAALSITEPRTEGQVPFAATVQVGTKIHCVFHAFATGGDQVFYCRFDMDLDAWDEIDTTQIEVSVSGVVVSQANNCDIAVRSDGSIVVVYAGENESVHGNPFGRQYWSVSSDGGQTWSAGVSLQDSGQIHRRGARILYNPVTDDCHFLTTDLESGIADIFQVTLNSSDVIQTWTDTGHNASNSAAANPMGPGIVLERGTEDHVRCFIPDAVGDANVLEFDSVADPVGFSRTELDTATSQQNNGGYTAGFGAFSNGQLITAWSRINPSTSFTEIFWSTDDGDTGAGDVWETSSQLGTPGATKVGGRIIDRADGAGEKFAVLWGDFSLANYMEIEPNDFSPTSLDELGQPAEGYNLSPVIV